MKLFFALLATVVLSGCALNYRLLEDGKEHAGSFSTPSRTMEVVIDGEKYTGTLSQGMSTGVTTMYTRRGPVMGTGVAGSGQFNATMQSASGKVLVCQFSSAMGTGSGTCEGLDGRRFAFVQP